MSLLKPKQIDKVIGAPIKIQGLQVSQSNSFQVGSLIANALQLAGNNGSSVPFQISTSVFTPGIVVAAPVNRSDVFDSVSKQKLSTLITNFEVYGRLVNSGSSYSLDLFYLDESGLENPYSIEDPELAAIDFDFIYRFSFDTLPADALVSSMVRNVSQDPKGQNAVFMLELLNVVSVNTLTPLSAIPSTISKSILSVNGKEEYCLGPSPAFTISGTTIAWSAINAGYALETTDLVYVKYYL